MQRRASITLAALAGCLAAALPSIGWAGCGCDKPAPPRASIRPFVAAPAQTVTLFNAALDGRCDLRRRVRAAGWRAAVDARHRRSAARTSRTARCASICRSPFPTCRSVPAGSACGTTVRPCSTLRRRTSPWRRGRSRCVTSRRRRTATIARPWAPTARCTSPSTSPACRGRRASPARRSACRSSTRRGTSPCTTTRAI